MVTTPSDIASGRRAGVTIGNFDGVHLGHQKLVNRTIEVCRKHDLDCIVVTFTPHPRAVFSGRPLLPLANQRARRQMLGSLGVDYLLELTFTKEMAALSPREFLEKYLYPLNLNQLIIGYDFCLGKGRSGDFSCLSDIGMEVGFDVEQVSPLMLEGAPISSSRLRCVIEAGDMSLARRMLGHPHGFTGIVLHGEGRGAGLGFPTANLGVPDVLLPPDGVYATVVHLGQATYCAVTNIGCNPTFDGQKRTVESFLLDCDANLYGLEIHVDFLGRLRGEKKFASVGELTAQIAQDIANARAYFSDIDSQKEHLR